MTGVTDERKVRNTMTKLNGKLPVRLIPVACFLKCGKAAVDSSKMLDPCLRYTFNGSYPQFNVRINRIFDKHNHINTFQGIGYFLYSERIYRCSCPDPQHIN